MSKIATIFEIAKVNGGEYRGESLPSNQWKWPDSTWMRNRLAEIIKKEQDNVLARATGERKAPPTD